MISLKRHSNAILSICALAFLAVIVMFVTYGAGAFTTAVNEAFLSRPSALGVGSFDLSGAAALDLRGLVR